MGFEDVRELSDQGDAPTLIVAPREASVQTDVIKKDPFIQSLVEDQRTQELVFRVKFQREYKPPDQYAAYGYFKGRLIIGRDTPINGGIYGGAGSREAIVVDDKTDGGVLVNSYVHLYNQIANGHNAQKSEVPIFILKAFELVRSMMPYDKDKIQQLISGRGADAEMHLSYFIQNRVGICRHQALFVAYLLEKLIQEKKLNGKVSVDRNSSALMGAHAWARFTTPDKKVFIIDPAQGYVGTLANAPESAWFYQYISRPEVSEPAYFFIQRPVNPVGSADREFKRIIISNPPLSEKEAAERAAETVVIPAYAMRRNEEAEQRSAQTVVSPFRELHKFRASVDEQPVPAGEHPLQVIQKLIEAQQLRIAELGANQMAPPQPEVPEKDLPKVIIQVKK